MKAFGWMLSVLALVLLGGCHSRSASFVQNLREYRGDGQIEETTVRSLYNAYPGFRIALPPITPAAGRESVFRVGPFPPTKHGEIGFVLLAEPAFDPRRDAQKVELSLELHDQKGDRVYQHDGIVARFCEPALYSDAWRGAPYWVFGAPFFHFQPNAQYTLHVRYTTREPSFRPTLRLVVWSGGFW